MGWSQIFLKISFEGLDADGIGESEMAGYEGQIVLADFDWGMKGKDVIKGTGTGRTVTRKINANELSIKKRFDNSSVTLMTAMRERKRITSARITVAHGFATGVGNDSLRDTFILEVQNGFIETLDLDLVGDGKGMVLQEELTIRYSKLKIDVFKVNENGRFSKEYSTFMADVESLDLT